MNIELLAPAKDALCGIEAINHGADAVYIGAPKFSARMAAANSIADIESLVKHAHKYYAKVYVAINTILTDEELGEAEKIIRELYNVGTDALIIQDMGITQLDLPPIPLHASTQMDNRTVEKVQFLEEAGFEQVVLARELSFAKIKEISSQTSVKLEAFIHGALCVSYSGQCYLSQATCGRSANRGNCAQLCRLPYSLTDADGKILVRDKHLLSLQDFNLSTNLEELINAGVSSLKIEGRLKDLAYVKNTTAYYRQILDRILEGSSHQKGSSGHCTYTFTPNVEKSFHRGGCSYFTEGRQKDITAFDTPKSTGERIGIVRQSKGSAISVNIQKPVNNGDGLCYFDQDRKLIGFKVNRAEGQTLFPAERINIEPGTELFRNFDQQFEKTLAKKSSDRRINATVSIVEKDKLLSITATDEDNISVSLTPDFTLTELAQNKERAIEQLNTQFKKSGNTIFDVKEVFIETTDAYFIPASIMAEWRRELLEKLEEERERRRVRTEIRFPETSHPYVETELGYQANLHNRLAVRFYKKHGVTHTEPSFEKETRSNVAVMTCKHCIRFSLGFCPKQKENKQKPKEPLYLIGDKGQKYLLKFDCLHCEMQLIK
ncbi:MAG: U32 family peptidase [Paludibacteraceae bacterium]|nr:U32 family peptidase [Paludibacteraceae bacterium]